MSSKKTKMEDADSRITVELPDGITAAIKFSPMTEEQQQRFVREMRSLIAKAVSVRLKKLEGHYDNPKK